MIDYYTRAAPAVLNHLRGRALTLKRYPNGVDQKYFYEKQKPSHAPGWVNSQLIGTGRRDIDYVLCDDLPTLVWLANLADLELHPSLALADQPDMPAVMAFDLDPGAPAALGECCEVALILRETLDHLGLQCHAKTSGSKGMQVYVPLNRGRATYHDTKPFAHGLAKVLEQRHDLIVSVMKKEVRQGKVFIDWSQNDRHKTTVGPYSLRARPRPTVSTPLTWEEVDHGAGGGASDLVFEAAHVLDRIEEHGDLFAGVLNTEQELPEL